MADNHTLDFDALDSPSAATPVSRLGGFEVLGLIGEGGMGVVYRVRDADLGRELALKTLRPSLAGTGTALQFRQEAQATAELQHPGIIPVHHYGELEDGRPYFTMKEVRGQPLSDVVAIVHRPADGQVGRSSEWTPRRLVDVAVRVTEAVAYAHDQGVVHRDIKPENVLLGEHGEVWLIDWGLATQVAPDGHGGRGSPGGGPWPIAGTPGFMSPEQALGQPPAKTCDVWALGVLWSLVASGELPFPGDTVDEVLRATRRGTRRPHRPSEAFPFGLQGVIDVALRPDKGDRYRDAGAMLDAVRPVVYGGGRVVLRVGVVLGARDTRDAFYGPGAVVRAGDVEDLGGRSLGVPRDLVLFRWVQDRLEFVVPPGVDGKLGRSAHEGVEPRRFGEALASGQPAVLHQGDRGVIHGPDCMVLFQVGLITF